MAWLDRWLGKSKRCRVAAVCWRRHPQTGAREFLLVRTRRGDRWTFPKGGLEPADPSPAAGAAREAWEEAGVRGTPASEPLTRYTHVAYKQGRPEPQEVEAWLLHVEQEGFPHEPGRSPTWFDATGAVVALAENQREPVAVAELHRVLRLAEERLHSALA